MPAVELASAVTLTRTTTSTKVEQSKSIHLRKRLLGLRARPSGPHKFEQDGLSDGADTATAPNSTTKTDIDRARGPARHRPRDSPHLVVAQHVAGANNHCKMAPIAPVCSASPPGDQSEEAARGRITCVGHSLAGGSTPIDDELCRSAIARMRTGEGRRIPDEIAQTTRRGRPAFFEIGEIAAQCIVGSAGQADRIGSRPCGSP